MRKFLIFLFSLLNKGKIDKNKVVGSISRISVTGDNSRLIDQSLNNEYNISQSFNTHETNYIRDYNKKFKYSLFADIINSILTLAPLFFLICSLCLLFLTKTIYTLYLLDILLIIPILFWSYKIPNKYRSFWIFKFNCFSVIVSFIFLITYKTIINKFIPTIVQYISGGIKITAFNKVIFISSYDVIIALFLIVSCYTVFILSSNTVKQWKVYLYGENEYPLNLKLMIDMLIAPFLPFVLLLLTMLLSMSINNPQSSI